ncbi:hypothetical protein [Bacteroides sp. ET336]|uniref:hypothetical protein n=1 Tax=Bacteroides sp. ET336 TaxID=2972459 RepID=UPI0021AC649F|nr:hypothetical protein [Bacteroides sp. ET336]
MIQVIARSESRAITGVLINLASSEEVNIDWSIWSINSTDKLYYYVLKGLPDGYYKVSVNGVESEMFHITSDELELKDTVLIQYSMKDNRERQDAIFWISDTQHFFDWRVHGGFKDDDWSFGVNNEQFTDADNNISEIYSVESLNKTFTLGNSSGCPIWFAAMLNRILSCTYVYFNGDRYIRMESNIPEKNILLDGYRSYVFKQALTSVEVVDYSESDNLLKIRRVDDVNYRKVSNKLLTI